MKIKFNGQFRESGLPLMGFDNRGYKYGDGLFETIKTVEGKILYWEDHYFRLMSSMRILRMDIPMNFTMEFLESEIQSVLKINKLDSHAARVRLSVDRGNGGYYKPSESPINYIIEASILDHIAYRPTNQAFKMDLFKDHFINSGLLSSLKTNNKIINVLGSIYASENDLDSCFLLNQEKSVVEALTGNVFLVYDKTIKTPPVEDGCLRGIMRKQIIDVVNKDGNYKMEEVPISPFQIQKADEIFLTNVIKGITVVTQYRKKRYAIQVATKILNLLNEHVIEQLEGNT